MSPDSKVHVANMEPTRVLSDPAGPHIGPMNLTIWEVLLWVILQSLKFWCIYMEDWLKLVHFNDIHGYSFLTNIADF